MADMCFFAAAKLSRKWLRSILVPILFFCYLATPTYSAAQADNKNIAALVPVIMSLLDSDSIGLQVGRTYDRVYQSDNYAKGIEFRYPKLNEPIEFSITITDIPLGGELEIYVNGELLGQLSNGVNTFIIEGSELNSNVIEIRPKAGTSTNWVITSISGYLSDGPKSRAEAQLLLMRATFGPKRNELDRVLQIGYEAWIDEQLQAPQVSLLARYDQELIDRRAALRSDLIASGITDPDELERLSIEPLRGGQKLAARMDGWWEAAINGNDQLRQRVIFALSQIFVVADTEDSGLFRGSGPAIYHDILSENAFGNYYDLLRNVTKSPQMASYLSLNGSQRANGGRAPDENFSRELMQLFSIGLIELNIDGTPKIDALTGKEIETYDQETVRNFARVFTGWSHFNRRREPIRQIGSVVPELYHDNGQKTLLNGDISPAGISAEEDMTNALTSVFMHPNVGPFFGRRLIERLVTSNPSPQYIARVASIFNNNGNGVRGDLKAVIKAILLDPEAINSASNRQTGGKMKEPLLRLSQLWRAFNARSDLKYIRYMNTGRVFGQQPYYADSVFNFYSPDYAPLGKISDQNLVAPEFEIITDGLLIRYLNAMHRFTKARPSTRTDSYFGGLQGNMILNLSEALPLANDSSQLMDFFDERLFGGTMTPFLKRETIAYIDDLPAESSDQLTRRKRVESALSILTRSPEFMLQR